MRHIGVGISVIAGLLCSMEAVVSASAAAQATEGVAITDASRIGPRPVREVWQIPAEPERAQTELRALLERARREGLTVAAGGARHSMGGQSISPDGIAVNMLPLNYLAFDEASETLRAGAGARWSEIVPFLDARGYSVAVMQSNNDFTVGGSVSVNCHGWQRGKAPIASTVNAFKIMLADGRVLTCSRGDNAELFSLALGGYGLFGIILEVELKVVRNEAYRRNVVVLGTADYSASFAAAMTEDTEMAYGRICIVPGKKKFLRRVLLNTYEREPGEVPVLAPGGRSFVRRAVFRAQIGSNWGKRLRWALERRDSKRAMRELYSRNELLSDGSAVFQEMKDRRTDILQEYFIPSARVEEFLEYARAIIPKHRADLLNVTIRDVTEDKDTFLRYADQPMFCFVMLFNMDRTVAADAEMQVMAQELIDAALACGGRYYLPYRLHASDEQFHRAYPQAKRFFDLKRVYDPEGRFVNELYLRYGRGESVKISDGR